MLIQLIIFLTKTKIFASEINSNGKAETISIKGNTEIKCEGKESVDELLECLYDAFNIDNFADDNFDIIILEAGADREIINCLQEKCKDAAKLNTISVEKLLPVIVSNKNLVQSGEEITVTFADLFYKIVCDENSIIKIGKARKNEDAVSLSENDFVCLYLFTASGITSVVDETKLDEARAEIAALQLKVNRYETELTELRKVQEEYTDLVSEQGKQEGKKEEAEDIFKKAEEYKEDEKFKKAFELYQKAADMGSMNAVARVGWCYLNGNGVDKDLEKAYDYCLKAAEQENTIGQNCLGTIYVNGEGVKKNVVKAAEWFHKAAQQGYALAQYNLGFLYENGDGVPQNYAQALEWYRKAAEQGVARAQSALGYMYDEGQGVTRNYNEALKWYKKAAAQGEPRGQNNLGCLYEQGEGVQQDYKESFKWFTRAAEQGWVLAEYNLGHCYFDGKGVEEDHEKAFEWYLKAAKQGHEGAKKILKNNFIWKLMERGIEF